MSQDQPLKITLNTEHTFHVFSSALQFVANVNHTNNTS